MPQPKSNWIAAVELGLVSSTFSTIVSQLGAARLGRDALVDWMTVAAIPGRDWALGPEPSFGSVLSGIAFHQSADLSWAVVFFGLFGFWTAHLRPLTIFPLAVAWAIFSSASEWFVLVPLFPFFQPLFTLQQPYWIGLLVHLSSAWMYPLFPYLRWPLGAAPNSVDIAGIKAWSGCSALIVAILAGLAFASSLGHDLPWMGADRDADQIYIRHMTTHHAQGIELANLAVARAQDSRLRALAKLMVAAQTGENRIFVGWWQSWFGIAMPECSPQERADMPGFLSLEQMERARASSPEQFDAVFVQLMTMHHAGAVKMADQAWHGRGDLRLRIMAHAMRHAQQGQIALMHGMSGVAAVSHAVRNMMADNVN